MNTQKEKKTTLQAMDIDPRGTSLVVAESTSHNRALEKTMLEGGPGTQMTAEAMDTVARSGGCIRLTHCAVQTLDAEALERAYPGIDIERYTSLRLIRTWEYR